MRRIIVFYFFFLLILVSPIFSADWYVRPAGGNYDGENGTSYANAWDGLDNVVWGTGGVVAGDTLYVCGTHIPTITNAARLSADGYIELVSGTAGSPIVIRGDYSGDPGIIWGVYIPAYESWVNEGSNTASITQGIGHYDGFVFEDIGTPYYDSYTLLTKATSIQNCKDTAGSFYFDGTARDNKLYVHCSDGGDPTGRVTLNRWGYRFNIEGVSGLNYITFQNIKLFSIYRWTFLANYNHTHWTFDNCTIWYSGEDLFAIGDTNHYMTITNCDLGYGVTLIYTQSGSNNAASYYNFSNNTVHHSGYPYFPAGDKHGIATQGGHDGIISGNEIYKVGEGIGYYIYKNQDCYNNICRYNFVHSLDTSLGNGQGILYGSNVDQDELQGITSGNQCYENICIGPGSGSMSYGIYYKGTGELECYNNVMYNFPRSYRFAGSYLNEGCHVKLRNNISLSPSIYHIEFLVYKTEGNYAIDSDYNFFYPISGNQFYFFDASGAGEYTLSQWQSISRVGCTFDPTSFTSDPKFSNASGSYSNDLDFQLRNDSPAIDTGIDVGLTEDYAGTSVPLGFAPDIGAYECIKPIYLKLSASPYSGDAPLTVNFTGEAMGVFPPFKYNWNFGDGNSSTEQNPQYMYSISGIYTAIFTVTDSNNNKESRSLTILAFDPIKSLTINSSTGLPASSEGGTTNPLPGVHLYTRGSSVQVNAIPDLDYRFSKWIGDVNETDILKINISLYMDIDKSISAFFCNKCGDVNGDSKITPADAQAAFDIFLGKITNPTECQKENADVNCDGTKSNPNVTASDAQAIFEKFIGINELPCDCSGNSRSELSATQIQRTGKISIISDDFQAKSGEEVFIPVFLEGASNIKSFGFDLKFPSDFLEFISIERTEISKDFIQLDVNEIATGVIRVGGYNNKPISSQSFESLVTLVFRAVKDISQPVPFLIIKTYDDIKNYSKRKEFPVKKKIK